MQPSPPESNKGSSKTILPPPPVFAIAASSSARTIALAAPSKPQAGSKSPGYSSHSYSHSTSPSTASGSLPDAQSYETPPMMVAQSQVSSASLNAQKRAYRQRRKDPSCDACRERKVKCDATETSACSECSSRNHKCQFTKETNRRMSSIKQVQDLQSQIAELTQMNSQLRTKVPDKEHLDVDRIDTKRRRSGAQAGIGTSLQQLSKPQLSNFEHVRNNVRAHAQGLFETPCQQRSHRTQLFFPGLPDVPSRADFAHLSRAYLDCIHEWYPILHWPTFQREVDEIYKTRGFGCSSREWIGLFFAVLACGSLQPADESSHSPNAVTRGPDYFESAIKALTPWPEELTIAHAQASLLISICATESNMKSLGTLWLASAVSVAQGLHIHIASGSGTHVENEVRRRLWWAIYTHDRDVALDMNRPMLIHELDCDIPLPTSIEDRYVTPHGAFRSQVNSTTSTGFAAVVQMKRMYASILRTLRSNVVPSQALQSHDEQIRSSMLLLPETYRSSSNAQLEAAALPTVLTVLTARFHLYRRNLTPIAHPAERAEALDRCISVAKDTAKYVSRALHNTSRSEAQKSWQTRVASIASNMVALHSWRCILVLCLRCEYDAALMCLHLSSTIGSIRKINSACGKHLSFFLDELSARLHRDPENFKRFDHDEELLAYASGDAQANAEHSWVWIGANPNSNISPQLSPHSNPKSRSHDEPMHDALPLRGSSHSLEHHTASWNDWASVEHAIRKLMEQIRCRTAPTPTYYLPPHNPVKRVQLAPDDRLTPKPSPNTPTPALSNASRISIANII